MESQLKSNLTSSKLWVRLVYMLLFAFFLYIASMVMIGLVVVQFIFALLTGNDNHKLRSFGHTLTTYVQQSLLFLTFNSDYKPFPFSDWPDEPSHPLEAEAIVGDAHNHISAAELAVKTDADPASEDAPEVVDPLARKAEARSKSAVSAGDEPAIDNGVGGDEESGSMVDPLARKAEQKGKNAISERKEIAAKADAAYAAESEEGPAVVDPLARQAAARGQANVDSESSSAKTGANALDEPFADREPPLVDPEAEKKILS